MDGEARVNVYLELKNRLKTGLDQAKQYLNKNVQDMKGKLNELKTTHIEAFNDMKNEIPGFGRALELVTNPIVLITAAVVALGGAMHHAMEINEEWEKGMAKINVRSNLTREGFEDLSKQLNIIGGRNAESNFQDTTVAYKNFIGGGRSTETNLKNTESSIRAAVAFGGDTGATAKSAADIMNSQGIQDATVVYDKLAMAAKRGRTEFNDMAGAMPPLVNMAKDWGMNIDQVSAALATLTAKGEDVGRASLRLQTTFRAITDPKNAHAFKEMGINLYDVHGKMRDLADITQDFNIKTKGLTDQQKELALAYLGIDSRAGAAFLNLAQSSNELRQNTDAIRNSQGALNEAYEKSETSGRSWVIIGNYITSIFNRIGAVINENIVGPLGGSLIAIFGGIRDYLIEFNDSTGFFSNLWDGIVSTVTGIWDTLTGIGIAIWGIIGPVIMWLSKSQIIKDLFWLIGQMAWGIGKILEGVGWSFKKIGEGLYWVFDHVIKPILDGIEWIYEKIKGLMGINSSNSKIKEAQEKLAETKPATETPKNLYEKPNAHTLEIVKKEQEKQDKKDNVGMSGGSQTKVITINKLSMIDGNFISTNDEFKGMSKADIERWLQEMFQRMMINLGRSYS